MPLRPSEMDVFDFGAHCILSYLVLSDAKGKGALSLAQEVPLSLCRLGGLHHGEQIGLMALSE